MEYIQWQDKYSVNVKSIDEQHMHFVGILNKLYEAIQSNSVQELPGIIDEIVAYADTHFETEEGYFDDFKYEGAAEHKEEHNKLKLKVGEFLERKDEDPIKLSYELLDFLEDWLVKHLADLDQKYSRCFNEHGLY